mmetsp:Transcript_11777/g.15176  ORF Transcript_11777/g.15176 Transcript_11777/m.15176 type:complete len:292 (+) Transcript_11777:65-940(+)
MDLTSYQQRAPYPAPSGSHCDRCPDNAKTSLLNRMYRVESVHFGKPNPEFISPVKNRQMDINPILMTRKGLSSDGAKEFNNLYLDKRSKRLTKQNNHLELFTGEHIMHPGSLGLGVVSTTYQPNELNPHYHKSMSHTQFRDPRAVVESSKQKIVARKEWLMGELEDMEAVVRETESSKQKEEAYRRSIGLDRGTRIQVKNTPTRVSSISTSFVRRPEIAYETSYQRSFSTFNDHDKVALKATDNPEKLHSKLAAVSQGQSHPMRDIKYGEFTAQCDLPHRKLESSLHPIGY